MKHFLASLFSLLLPMVASANWVNVGKLNVPPYYYSFLAPTPDGNLLAATFNSTPLNTPPTDLPALLIVNPASEAPQVLELSRVSFQPQRGYGGIATDEEGNYYVSGDTGDATTSFIMKFNRDGSQNAQFGANGTLLPGRRCLGMDVFGPYLVVAMDWGRIWVFDRFTGRKSGELEQTPSPFFMRDIAIDPKSLRIFGVAEGGLLTFGNGTPWLPKEYKFRQLAPKSAEPRSGEGISIDPLRRTVLITPIPGNTLNEIQGNGQINRFPITTATPDAHLADSVLSFDGQYLFVSDMRGRTIHVMQRNVDQIIAATGRVSATGTTSAVSGQGTVPAPQWNLSYEAVIEEARTQKRPIIIYFRSAGATDDFENNVMLTDLFNQHAHNGNYVCVFEDVSKSRLLAYKFGVYRVPHISIISPYGGTAAEFTYQINADDLFKAMNAVASDLSRTGG
ncbi:MAG: hypothetical protein SFY68_12960 [Candidatus Sumerlaeia bacterium]|nr:hypothetical protein [Candidatus Sumerlaeia bacterium]